MGGCLFISADADGRGHGPGKRRRGLSIGCPACTHWNVWASGWAAEDQEQNLLLSNPQGPNGSSGSTLSAHKWPIDYLVYVKVGFRCVRIRHGPHEGLLWSRRTVLRSDHPTNCDGNVNLSSTYPAWNARLVVFDTNVTSFQSFGKLNYASWVTGLF